MISGASIAAFGGKTTDGIAITRIGNKSPNKIPIGKRDFPERRRPWGAGNIPPWENVVFRSAADPGVSEIPPPLKNDIFGARSAPKNISEV